MSGWTSDFIADFMTLTEGAISPPIFKLWSAITLVSGALERRVWVKTGPRTAYPNLYTLLVAPPAVGKFVVEETRNLWQETLAPGTKLPAFHVASDSVTNASLMDELGKSKNICLRAQPALTYHSLLVAAEEFQVLLPSYDMQFIASLNSIYNNKSLHREARRTGTVRELKLENPQFTILAGAQPSYFASTFPEEAWATGFARRVIMVYSGEAPTFELFGEVEDQEATRKVILGKLSHLANMWGQMAWTGPAATMIGDLHRQGIPPVPTHSKLAHYARARTLHLLKLTMVSAIARTGAMTIEEIDVIRARAWLLEAEALMPDIFREMIGKSDSQVLEEMHYFVTAMWAKAKQQPVSGESIRRFLLQRVPHEKVETLVMASERANILARVAGTADLWVPRPKHLHGTE